MQSIARDLAKTQAEYVLLILLFASFFSSSMNDAEITYMGQAALEEFRSYENH